MKKLKLLQLLCLLCTTFIVASCVTPTVQEDFWETQESSKQFKKLTEDNDNLKEPVDLSRGYTALLNSYFCVNSNETKLYYLKAQSLTQTNIFSKAIGVSSIITQETFVDKQVFDPSVSPDNKILIYSDHREKGWAIISQQLGSTNLNYHRNTNLTSFAPVFFPKDKKILFCEKGPDGKTWIYQQKFDIETDVSQLTIGQSPCFFPNGKRFVFVRKNPTTKRYELLIYDLTTSAVTTLKSDPAVDYFQPSVSRNGQWIAYTQYQQVGRTPGNYNIFMVDANANNTTQITFNPSDDVNPVWSKMVDSKLYILSKRTQLHFNVWSLKAY